MKTLLITNYWYPYNSPGALRWAGFGEYLEFDVLTCKRPLRGFYDTTMPNPPHRVFRFGYRLPAILWGFLVLIPALFKRYDSYIITSPPESLLFTGMILKMLGKKGIIDMRDSIRRPNQKHWFLWFYEFCYKRCWAKIVACKLIDPTKPVVYHGYDEIHKRSYAFNPCKYYTERVNYREYNYRLSIGMIPDFSNKPKGYGASSTHNIVRLGYKPNQELADEEWGQHSWKEGAEKIWKHITNEDS